MVAVRYFQEVAKAGSFRRASERLNIAASAINRHVCLLEEELGVRLLDRGRGRGGVKLTAAGEVLIRRVGYALNELQVARTEIAALQGIQQGQVTIGMPDALAKDLAIPLVTSFHEQHPNSNFEIIINNRAVLMDMLLEDRLDVALAYDVAPQIAVDFLAEYAFGACVVVNRDHPLAGRKAVSLGECIPYPLALPADLPYRRALLARMSSEAGVTPRPLVTTNSYEMMRDLVESGMAISFQANLPVDRSKTHPGLTYVPLNEPLGRYSLLSICARQGRRFSVTAQVFLRFIEQHLDGIAGEYRLTNSIERNHRKRSPRK